MVLATDNRSTQSALGRVVVEGYEGVVEEYPSDIASPWVTCRGDADVRPDLAV